MKIGIIIMIFFLNAYAEDKSPADETYTITGNRLLGVYDATTNKLKLGDGASCEDVVRQVLTEAVSCNAKLNPVPAAKSITKKAKAIPKK